MSPPESRLLSSTQNLEFHTTVVYLNFLQSQLNHLTLLSFYQIEDVQSKTPSQTPTLIVTSSQTKWYYEAGASAEESGGEDEDRALSDEEPWFDAEKKPVLLGDAFENVFDTIEDDEDWDDMPLNFRPHLLNALKRIRARLEDEAGERLILTPNPKRRQRARDQSALENNTGCIFPVICRGGGCGILTCGACE